MRFFSRRFLEFTGHGIQLLLLSPTFGCPCGKGTVLKSSGDAQTWEEVLLDRTYHDYAGNVHQQAQYPMIIQLPYCICMSNHFHP